MSLTFIHGGADGDGNGMFSKSGRMMNNRFHIKKDDILGTEKKVYKVSGFPGLDFKVIILPL